MNGGALGVSAKPAANVDPCPLCGARKARLVSSTPYSRIWESYRTDLSVAFSPAVLSAHTPQSHATLYDCATCGLGYFSPLVPGNTAFYSELMSQVPYVENRWEFGVVANLVQPDDEVLDFGAGSGVFLRRIADGVRRAVGVDHNADAVIE